ncbi:MAG: BatA (Bacteroides aerotolerance operon) [uncultured Sulfurovum sp.]|uniref:BatA (Bacteroides aerotolerance operon) n=1 Tax=uncultured Sulfurovum sp. TaxID=269237 RepID=A0A6S6SAD9_9BACT|nr:MAG: BatA (Bacteroides aerotolerance operon) [uncultured Sulfurovum sp.]
MNFTFGSLYLLFLLLLIPCFFWCKQHNKVYFFPKLAWIKKQNTFYTFEQWLKVLLFSLMVFSLAKPFVYDSNDAQHKKGRDLILALDASGSMGQSGFNPKDRFKNKFEINIELANAFIKNRHDDNMGVVLFGTFAYSASPLTYDLESLAFLLGTTNVGIAGESTAIGDAIMQSIRSLTFGEAKSKAIILLTDGYHNAGTISPKVAVNKAKKHGIKIYTIGIGKKSDYDVTLLDTIAKETGAKSYAASSREELQSVYADIHTLEPSPIRSENYLNQKLLILFPLGIVFILLLLWTLRLQRNVL